MLNNRFRDSLTMPAISSRMLALTLVALTPARVARAEPISAPFRAAILLRALGYERGVAKRQGDLLIAVVAGQDPRSQADAHDMRRAFEELAARLKVADRSVRVRAVQHEGLESTLAELQAVSPTAVYFAIGLEAASLSLSVDADRQHWIPMCADGAVLGPGCALGVRAQGKASQLVVDLKRAERAGLSFDPRMLRLCEVIR